MWSRRSAIERCPSPWNRKQLCPIVTIYRRSAMILMEFCFLEHRICFNKISVPIPSRPSLARYLLLLGMNVFGFKAKGIARSQIDDSTCCPTVTVCSKYRSTFWIKKHKIKLSIKTKCLHLMEYTQMHSNIWKKILHQLYIKLVNIN